MSVRLIALTKPVVDLDNNIQTANDLISYVARVSNTKNQHKVESAHKLLRYLIKNKHWSPFELINIVMEIKTTRDIGRQILRHRSFAFQEFSQRYAVVTEFETRELRLQDTKNRQNSIDVEADHPLRAEWYKRTLAAAELAQDTYKWALENGVAKEQARVVLPEGMASSTMYMTGSLRSWIHYCQLRMGNGTQKEHQVIAKMCWDILVNEFAFLNEVINESGN